MLNRRMAVAALGVLAVMALAMPAGAAPAPQVTDECGDADTRGEWNDDSMSFEENKPHLDVKSGSVGGLYAADGTFDGFTAAVTLCGTASAAEGGYLMQWHYGDQCYGTVSWSLPSSQAPGGDGLRGAIHNSDVAEAVVSEDCYRQTQSQNPLESNVEEKYRVVLPASSVAFVGDTVTFTVPKSLLPEAAAPRLAAGTKWAGIGALAMQQGTGLWAGYGDTNGNSGSLMFRTDFALGGASYTVGEDATSS